MGDEQTAFNDDSEILRSAAGMLESLADELSTASGGDPELFSFKSAHTLNLVVATLRDWATKLTDGHFIDQLAKNEAILRMVKPGA